MLKCTGYSDHSKVEVVPLTATVVQIDVRGDGRPFVAFGLTGTISGFSTTGTDWMQIVAKQSR
jgi:hypothetical protein